MLTSYNSVSINLNVLEEQRKMNDRTGKNITKIFYSGSVAYPEHNQLDPDNPDCREESAYPDPDSEYGWEKLFSEKVCTASYHRNYGIPVRVTRYHNIFGPEGTWDGVGRRSWRHLSKVAFNFLRLVELLKSGVMENRLVHSSILMSVLRSSRRLMDSNFIGPVNIGSEENGNNQSVG